MLAAEVRISLKWDGTVYLFILPLTISTVDAGNYWVLDFGMEKAFRSMVSILSPISQKHLKKLLNLFGIVLREEGAHSLFYLTQ